MSVTGFDHVNIRTMDVPRTLGFFEKVLGMRVSPFPGQTTTETAGWVHDADDHVVIHVNHGETVYPTDGIAPWSPVTGSGAAHHIALNCSDYDDMIGKLESNGFDYVTNEVPQISLRQLFVYEVNGILMELNFRG